jgi:hypothetical protein
MLVRGKYTCFRQEKQTPDLVYYYSFSYFLNIPTSIRH